MRDPIRQKITHVWRNVTGVDLDIVSDEVYRGERRGEILRSEGHCKPGAVTVRAVFYSERVRREICNRVSVRRKMARRGEF